MQVDKLRKRTTFSGSNYNEQESHPCALLLAHENHLENPVIISEEKNKIHIYYFYEFNMWFNLWDDLEGNISKILLKSKIMGASKSSNILEKTRQNEIG